MAISNSGYSGTPLAKKLGIKPDSKIFLINAPEDYFGFFDLDLRPQVVKSVKNSNFIHLFALSQKQLKTDFSGVIKQVSDESCIWISWYKKTAKQKSDVTEDGIREVVLATDWVDVKVCAVNDLWSGLKIVKRKAARTTFAG